MFSYRQAQATVLQGIKQLQKLGVSTRRPEDFFAQMAKSDDHMGLVRLDKIICTWFNVPFNTFQVKFRTVLFL